MVYAKTDLEIVEIDTNIYQKYLSPIRNQKMKHQIQILR